MNKFLLIIILAVSSVKEVKAQFVSINSQVVFPNVKDTLNYIRFKINNQSFGEKDTIIQIKVNAKGFDTCQAIIVDDTINFLTKFFIEDSLKCNFLFLFNF